MEAIYSFIDLLLPFAWLKPVFMKNALIAMLLFAPAAAMLGSHITAFRMAFFSDAIAHSAFTGIAIGFLFSVNPLVSMVFFAIAVALAVIGLERKSLIEPDSVISVIMSLGIAVGLAIISLKQSYMRDFQQYLFGYVFSVTPGEIALFGCMLAAVAVFTLMFFNRLTLLAFQPELALNRYKSAGIGKILFSVLTAVVVAVSIKIIGMLLITSMLVIPSVTARLVARSTRWSFWATLALSLGASVSGLALSFYVNISAGPAVIIILSVFFLAAVGAKAAARIR